MAARTAGFALACLERLLPHTVVEPKMSVVLERSDERREQGLEPLAANPVGGFPENDEGLADSGVVHTEPGRRTGAVADGTCFKTRIECFR